MRIGLLVFPALHDTHDADSAASSLGQRLEPSVLSLASERPGDSNEFIEDNLPHDGIDLYLCSVYTRGWGEFKTFSGKVGRDKIIAGGYHPTARPLDTLLFAHKVVTGLCGNIEEIIEAKQGGVFRGTYSARPLRRDLVDMRLMSQVYPDVTGKHVVGSSISSVGCPYDCDFCATPGMSGRKMISHDLAMVEKDVNDLVNLGVQALFIRDESFATHPNFGQVARIYGKGKFDVLYSFGTASALSKEKIRTLSDNGWHSLCLGLEDVGTAYRKNKNLSECAKNLRDNGLGLTLSFIIDDHGKDMESIRKNYKALTEAFFSLKPIMTCSNFFMPLPGTPLGKRMEHLVTEDMWAKFDSKTPLFSANKEIEMLHRRLSVAVQTKWYRSKEYSKLRRFDCGDTLHRRIEELERAFGLSDGIPDDLAAFL